MVILSDEGIIGTGPMVKHQRPIRSATVALDSDSREVRAVANRLLILRERDQWEG